MVTGLSLAHTRGLGGYAGGADTGRMTSAVTGLYPWIGFKASERVTVWTVAGYGAGAQPCSSIPATELRSRRACRWHGRRRRPRGTRRRGERLRARIQGRRPVDRNADCVADLRFRQDGDGCMHGPDGKRPCTNAAFGAASTHHAAAYGHTVRGSSAADAVFSMLALGNSRRPGAGAARQRLVSGDATRRGRAATHLSISSWRGLLAWTIMTGSRTRSGEQPAVRQGRY